MGTLITPNGVIIYVAPSIGICSSFDIVYLPAPVTNHTYVIAVDEHLREIYKIGILPNGSIGSYGAIGMLPADQPGAIEYDPTSQTLFWADVKSGVLKSAVLDGQERLFTDILDASIAGMVCIVVNFKNETIISGL